MTKFINPFTDVGFKKIFGQEMTKDLLIDFLNDLLVDEKHIIDITFLDKEILPEYMGDRGVIYDIYCTAENGEQFIVEMQNKQHVHFRERALYYLSKTVARQGEKGAEWKFDLKAVYGVFFMNFRFVRILCLQIVTRTNNFPTSFVLFLSSCLLFRRRSKSVKLTLNDGFMY